MPEPVTLQQFYDRLARHDWFYEYSDDHSVYTRGRQDAEFLRTVADRSPEHQAIYTAWCDHMFSGKPWNTEKAPKPERPKE